MVGGAAAAKWLPRLETKDNLPLNPNSLADKLSVDQVDLAGKRVLIRVDYNVPIKDGKITDSRRVDETLETLRLVLSRKPKALTLIAHLGQPTAQDRKENFKAFSLAPVAELLSSRLGLPVKFLPDCVGPEVEREINECTPGSVFLCENLRFHIEEIGSEKVSKDKTIKASKEDREAFQQALSRLGDVFVFEAFGAAHRPHSSISGIKVPVRVAGLLMRKELDVFSQVLDKPKKPLLAILGGSKISDKIAVIENLINSADEIIIGGGMAYTFKKLLHGVKIGDSLYDDEGAKFVDRIMRKARERKVTFHFPVDHVITDQRPGKKADADVKEARVGVTDDEQGIPAGWMALDIGPASRAQFSKVIERAATVIWNGPMGVFEMPAFSAGTLSVMCDCVRATKRGATVVIGGGDTGAATDKFYYHHKPISEQVSHVSTGGGSSLVLLEGKLLPGVASLVPRSDVEASPTQ